MLHALHVGGLLTTGIVGSILLWIVGMSVVMDLAAQTAMTNDQQFFIEIIKAIAPGIGVIALGLVPAWFARKANKNSEVAATKAAEAVEKTVELSKSIDGQLDELKRLWQSEANLLGRQQERDEAESKKIDEAAIARTVAKEDRNEGRESMVKAQEVIPVETRTEAAEAQEEIK